MTFLGYSPYFNQVFVKPTDTKIAVGDLTRQEFFLLIPLLIATVLLGLFPNVILETLHVPVTGLLVDLDANEFTRYFYYIIPENNVFLEKS